MGAHSRGTIKTDIPNEIQTGDILEVRALPQTKLDDIIMIHSDGVPTMTSFTFYYYPPVNTVVRVHQLYMHAPSAGISGGGIHGFIVIVGSGGDVLKGISAFNSPIEFNYGHWYIANFTDLPPGAEAQRLGVQSMYATLSIPIAIEYQNTTTNNQVGVLTVKLIPEIWSKWV